MNPCELSEAKECHKAAIESKFQAKLVLAVPAAPLWSQESKARPPTAELSTFVILDLISWQQRLSSREGRLSAGNARLAIGSAHVSAIELPQECFKLSSSTHSAQPLAMIKISFMLHQAKAGNGQSFSLVVAVVVVHLSVTYTKVFLVGALSTRPPPSAASVTFAPHSNLSPDATSFPLAGGTEASNSL